MERQSSKNSFHMPLLRAGSHAFKKVLLAGFLVSMVSGMEQGKSLWTEDTTNGLCGVYYVFYDNNAMRVHFILPDGRMYLDKGKQIYRYDLKKDGNGRTFSDAPDSGPYVSCKEYIIYHGTPHTLEWSWDRQGKIPNWVRVPKKCRLFNVRDPEGKYKDVEDVSELITHAYERINIHLEDNDKITAEHVDILVNHFESQVRLETWQPRAKPVSEPLPIPLRAEISAGKLCGWCIKHFYPNAKRYLAAPPDCYYCRARHERVRLGFQSKGRSGRSSPSQDDIKKQDESEFREDIS